MNPIGMLKKDHRSLEKLLKEILTTTKRALKKREKLFDVLSKEIDLHTKIEETIFYPTLRQFPQAKELVLHAIEEHYYIDVMMSDLKSLDVDEENWAAKFNVLKENLHHHIKKEETTIFPLAEKIFTKEELNLLADEMQELKVNLSSGVISSVISSLMAAPPNFINDKVRADKKSKKKN